MYIMVSTDLLTRVIIRGYIATASCLSHKNAFIKSNLLAILGHITTNFAQVPVHISYEIMK
jgi:hypothetical protein